MVTTRGKKIDFNAESSDGERDVGKPEKPAPKRRKTKKSDSADDNTGFEPGSSSAKGKDKAALEQNQLITRRGGKGGKLRDLMNMPIDIFTEVCSYLDPYDLRRLALASKRLWGVLMTKEARHIWKTSLASVPDLPECPTDLNEPQYVFLLYSSECYTILARNYRRSRSRAGGLRKNDERHFHVEALKKAGHEYEALSGEEAWEYLSLLQEKRNYRKEGWDEKDFPIWNKDFRDLVLKDQKLTPKVWQNIKPKLEPLLETHRAERLAEEKEAREWNRRQAIIKSISNWFLPKSSKVLALSSVKPLLENDTETVTEEQWVEVAPEVRLFLKQWWRDSLKQLLGSGEKAQLRPPHPECQELIKRLLKDLEVDYETVKLSDTIITDQNQKNYLCTRCDENIATYMNFPELIEHYLEVQKWFDKVTEAVQISPDNCYPSRTVNSELPKIVNDHDRLSRAAPLVQQDDDKTQEAVLKLQRDFKKERLTNPLCDTKGIGGVDLEERPWRGLLRHDKEPNLETDMTSDIFYSTTSCPL
ncbi:hypothetical protein FRC00_001474 [Tulasnella sp. 408]|nr:hypothetical protein FRC00_001474 [Tulasnella sp. 408]